MTHTIGPRADDPHPVPLFYPPGFEPSATDPSDDHRIAPSASSAAPRPTIRRQVARRPVMAGFLGTALVALIGFSGGLLAAPAVSGLGGHQVASQSASARVPTASSTSTQVAGAHATATSSALSALAPPPDDGAGG